MKYITTIILGFLTVGTVLYNLTPSWSQVYPSPVIAQTQQVINARSDNKNCNPWNIATSMAGGVKSSVTVCSADEGETILNLQAAGYNSNGTFICNKARGTNENPLAIKNGDGICYFFGAGWQTDGLDGGASGSAFMKMVACADFTPSNNCTAIVWGNRRSGVHPSVPMLDEMGLQDGVLSITERFRAQGIAGVDCSGPPSANFRVTGGVVTRC